MKYKGFHKHKESIDMTPLLDIIFLVLIFFMVGATFELNRALKMSLPDTLTSDGNISENKIIIEIDKNSKIAVNGVIVEEKEFSDKILSLTPNEDTETYILGDEYVPYKTVIKAIDILKLLGINKISLVTDLQEGL